MWYGHVCCFLSLIKRTIIMLTYNQWNPGVVSAVIDILHMFCAHYIVRFLSEALQMKTIFSISFMLPRELMHLYIWNIFNNSQTKRILIKNNIQAIHRWGYKWKLVIKVAYVVAFVYYSETLLVHTDIIYNASTRLLL